MSLTKEGVYEQICKLYEDVPGELDGKVIVIWPKCLFFHDPKMFASMLEVYTEFIIKQEEE